MAIRIYVDRKTKMPLINAKTGKPYLEAYWNARSSLFPSIRVQKYKKCETEAEAIKAEKLLIKEVIAEVARKEAEGTCWKSVINAWQSEAKQDDGSYRNPVTGKVLTEKTVVNTVNMLFRWTDDWLSTPAGKLNRGNGKEFLRRAEDSELQKKSIQKIKSAIKLIYDFGLEEGIIKGVQHSPVHGLLINKDDPEKLPEILTVEEVQKLLFEARVSSHPWFPVWALALTTGMRSSELFALRKANVNLSENYIRICESWDWFLDRAKSTKANYWRTAPIAPSMKTLIQELMSQNSNSEFLLPRFKEWEQGHQAQVLRNFCESIGVTSVRFHALRACFATHLLASGVNETRVMRIGGWRDLKTFQIYIRLSGIKEKGATDQLSRLILPDDDKVFDHISSLYQEKAA